MNKETMTTHELIKNLRACAASCCEQCSLYEIGSKKECFEDIKRAAAARMENFEKEIDALKIELDKYKPKPHWTHATDNTSMQMCSECGFIVQRNLIIGLPLVDFLKNYKYCPRCGVKLVEDKENE